MKNNRLIMNLSSEVAEIAVLSKNQQVESLNLMVSGISKGSIVDNDSFIESFQDPKFLRIINTYDFEDIIVGISPSKISTMTQKNTIFDSQEVTVLDPFHSLDLIIQEVNNKTDLLILLFNASQQDLTKIYNQNYDIDMIISSKSRTRSSDGGSKIPTYIAGDRGKILYKFKFNLVDKDLPIVDLAWCENTISRVTDRLDKMKMGDINADLYSIYKNDKKTLNRVISYEAQLDKANQLLENAINTLQFERIELGKTVFDRTDILKIVDEGKLKIKELVGPMPPVDNHDNHHHGHNHDGHDHSH